MNLRGYLKIFYIKLLCCTSNCVIFKFLCEYFLYKLERMISGTRCTRNIPSDSRSMEPIIATIIIIAIVLIVGMAVAYWMGSMAGLYTRFEQLEIKTIYATKVTRSSDNVEYFVIYLAVENKGTAAATIEIDNILINDVPLKEVRREGVTTQYWYSNEEPSSLPLPADENEVVKNSPQPGAPLDATAVPVSITIGPGETYYIIIAIPAYASIADTGTVASGVTIEVKLHTAGGREYMKPITLP